MTLLWLSAGFLFGVYLMHWLTKSELQDLRDRCELLAEDAEETWRELAAYRFSGKQPEGPTDD